MASTSKADDWEACLYVIGERLQMPVYKIKEEMPLSELIMWCRHFSPQQEDKEPDPMAILRAFGC